MKYICRIDTRATLGWWVRLQPQRVSKLFSDCIYGGKRKAKRAAIQFRDKMVEKVGHHKKVSIRDKRCTTGVVGVSYHCYKRWSTYKGYLYGPYWIEEFKVKYTDRRGMHRSKSFSIKKHGRAIAWELAKEARRKGIAT